MRVQIKCFITLKTSKITYLNFERFFIFRWFFVFFKPIDCLNEIIRMIPMCFRVKGELKIGFLVEKTRALFFRLLQWSNLEQFLDDILSIFFFAKNGVNDELQKKKWLMHAGPFFMGQRARPDLLNPQHLASFFFLFYIILFF